MSISLLHPFYSSQWGAQNTPQLWGAAGAREVSPEAAAKILGHLQWLSGTLQRQKAAGDVLYSSVLVCRFLRSGPGSSGTVSPILLENY